MLRICTVFVLVFLPQTVMAEISGIVRVIDADTWDVNDQRVRLFGIDAPETDQKCRNPLGQSWACGVWSAEQVRAQYQGRQVRCEALDTDRYRRSVARCFAAGRDVARDMVAAGWAFAYPRYSTIYVGDEKRAAISARGLHASKLQSPAAFRAARFGAPNGRCAIKGNISSGGARIYHVPGQRFYGPTRISPARGERWFCSEDEALASGWRRALR